MTYHNERAETSAFNALCEFYRRSVSYSLEDSPVADQRFASVPARRCVAFVGAGFSMPCGMPNWATWFCVAIAAARR